MELSPATKAWIVLGVGVAAYDIMCPPGQTLSEGVDRAMETRLGRAATIAGVGSVALHLCNAIPQKYDWLHQTVELRRAKLKVFDNYYKKEWNDDTAN